MRAAVHLAAALALAALAFAVGRWLRDPSPGGSLLILLGAAILWVAAVRRLYGPGCCGDSGVAEGLTNGGWVGKRGTGRAARMSSQVRIPPLR